ncbi:sulfatase [Opitutales bacterium]|nr:sulfatase [Opitutales bacterium]
MYTSLITVVSNRKRIVAACNLLLLAAGFAQAAARPNVIVVMVDDLGWRDLGCYGSTFFETPHVDAFAQTAMRFTDAYAAPSCSPTRSTVLTGQYHFRTGFTSAAGHVKGKWIHEERREDNSFLRAAAPNPINYLDPKYDTLAETMQAAGYATSFFGKWHLGHKPYIPEAHGFETVRGGRWHSGPPGADPKRQFYPPWKDCDTLDSDLPPDTHVDDYITDLAIEYIEAQREQPFFMCFWPYSVHAPFQSKPELIEKWQAKVDPNNPQRCPTMAAMIEVMDENFGRLMAALKRTGLDDDTIVLFLSDNGGQMYSVVDGTRPTNNAPLRGGKVNNTEGGVRIPFMVRWPGVTDGGSVNHSVIATTDIYASLLEMTAQPAKPQAHVDSVSFVPALRGASFDRGPLICDQPRFGYFVGQLPCTFIREGDWKLTRYWFEGPEQTHRDELYNLKQDLGERLNVAESYPEVRARLAKELDVFYETSGVLHYHPNQSYHGRRFLQWEALSDAGELTVVNDAIRMRADAPGFGMLTPMVPHMSTAVASFEARAVEHCAARASMVPNGQARAFTLSKQWESYSFTIKTGARTQGFQLELPEGGHAEFRNLKLSTPEGTVMIKYPVN